MKLPARHQCFIEDSIPRLKIDQRIIGVAIGGSYLLHEMDEFSDLDLIVYIEPEHYAEVLKERQAIVQELGPLLESFTGEHVGEPRLLICLCGPPLLHVDYKFVSLDDIHDKVETPVILWERDTVISEKINLKPAIFPHPDSSWIEDRFWTWIHYTATKIGRGELFEAIEAISFIRSRVLGPMILAKKRARPQGLRKIEFYASQPEQHSLRATLAVYDSRDCLRALRESMDLYASLRKKQKNKVTETLVTEYLKKIESDLDEQRFKDLRTTT